MGQKSTLKKTFSLAKNKFYLEIYTALEGTNNICWEIFPDDYKAALYAFSNKNKLDKLVVEKYLYEPKK